jgi:uncharacterized protein (TIGR03663 family)
MPSKNINLIITFIVLLIAIFFRIPDLSERPMHGDEAVNALKFSQLLESGTFEYDPTDYHGPTLYYFTLPVSWIRGQYTLKDLNETTLRIVPVVFGIGLILLIFILKPDLGWQIPILMASLLSISPAFVFYSRYYIHEMILVFCFYLFLFSGYRYIRSKNNIWILSSGLSLGLLISTKETWILLLFSILLAVVLVYPPSRENRKNLLIYIKSIPLTDFIIFILSVVLTPVILYSDFFTHLEGLQHSLSTFSIYFNRATSVGVHSHPWYMYFYWLLFFFSEGGSFWSEGIIAIFAIIGIISIISKKYSRQNNSKFFQFILAFVLITVIVYSIIPYKTPWNLLTFWFGIIFLASVGIITMYKLWHQKSFGTTYIIICALAFGHLGWQTYQLVYKKSCDVSNPYVYAHPGRDVFKITNTLKKLALQYKDHFKIPIQVIAKDNDYWPLPWYLRDFKRVGWWDRVDYLSDAAPIIIIQSEMVDSLIYKLYELPPPGHRHLYLPLFDDYIELRPGIELQGYIRKDFWDDLNVSEKSLEIPE